MEVEGEQGPGGVEEQEHRRQRWQLRSRGRAAWPEKAFHKQTACCRVHNHMLQTQHPGETNHCWGGAERPPPPSCGHPGRDSPSSVGM